MNLYAFEEIENCQKKKLINYQKLTILFFIDLDNTYISFILYIMNSAALEVIKNWLKEFQFLKKICKFKKVYSVFFIHFTKINRIFVYVWYIFNEVACLIKNWLKNFII